MRKITFVYLEDGHPTRTYRYDALFNKSHKKAFTVYAYYIYQHA